MRFLVPLIAVALPLLSLGQNVPPPWPQITLDSCPAFAPSRNPSQRTSKYGHAEDERFITSLQMLKAKNYAAAADGFAEFAQEFPDSDYRETALIFEITAQGYLKNQSGVVKVAEQLVRLPLAESGSREVGFVTLCDQLSPSVRPDDAEKERKLSDLEKWTRCGEEALGARLANSTPNMPQDAAFENTRKISENVLDRTAGFVAYMRQDYALAASKLEQARDLNSEDALTYLWLAVSEFLSPTPDSNSGIFYLARWADKLWSTGKYHSSAEGKRSTTRRVHGCMSIPTGWVAPACTRQRVARWLPTTPTLPLGRTTIQPARTRG